MTFPSAEQLNTLADARDAFVSLLSTHQSTAEELDSAQGDLTAANEMLDEANGRITSLLEQLKNSQEAEQNLKNELSQATERIQGFESQITELKSAAKSAESKAAEICASVGVDPVQITPGGDSKETDLMEQFRAIKDPAKQTAFFRKHRETLINK